MKRQCFRVLLPVLLLVAAVPSFAQLQDWDTIESSNIISSDSLVQGKYTLLFINKDTALNPVVKQRMIDAFFKVYPAEAKAYNPKTLQKVIFIIDPSYDGVAATSGRIVRYNPGWFHQHPEDIDVVTHEVMHIVQSYPDGAGPGWITE